MAKLKLRDSGKTVVRKTVAKARGRDQTTPHEAKSALKENATIASRKSGAKVKSSGKARVLTSTLAAKGKLRENARATSVVAAVDKVAMTGYSMTALSPSAAEVSLIENIMMTAWQASSQVGLVEKTMMENQSRAITK